VSTAAQRQDTTEHTLTKKDIEATRFAAAYIKHGHNGTRAALEIKPHLSETSAASEAYKQLRTTQVQTELKRLNDEIEESAKLSRAEIIQNMRRISEKAEKSKSYNPAISAMKEVGILSGAYDREGDDHANYSTFINNLTVNLASTPQDVVNEQQDNADIPAEWEEIQ